MSATRPRRLYIVATDRRLLYDSLRRQFAADPNVEVIFDRRREGGDGPRGATPAERCRADRRRMEQEHLLRTLGVILVNRDYRDEVPARGRKPARPRRREPVPA